VELKSYYRNLREIEASITEPFPVIASLATPDGGRAGTLTETPRSVAARMLADGQARLANEEESQAFREAHAEARRKAEQEVAAAKVHIAVLSQADFGKLKTKSTSTEE
jgi:hypothetical protein